MTRIRNPFGGIATGALAGLLLGLAAGLLHAVVADGAVNPLFFASVGTAVGAGVGGDRPRRDDARPGTTG